MISVAAYVVAPPLALALDWLMFSSMMPVFGMPARDYHYREFVGIRTLFILGSSLPIAHSAVTSPGDFGALAFAGTALFLLAHFYIYFSIFYEAWRERR